MSCASATEYDVFLSFRGLDTSRNITSVIYKELVQRKIRTFRDDMELENGQPIPLELYHAINNSKIAVVVFSANYAACGRCLEELVKIMDLQKKSLITVKLIFYGVNPCDVRRQIKDVAEQFKKHEGREDPAKVLSWRSTLTELAALSGCCSSEWTDAEVVDRIADEISRTLIDTSHPKHMKEIKELLDLNPNEELSVLYSENQKRIASATTSEYYEVFLSFRGLDTRRSFTSVIYKELVQRKILTFKDDKDLENGNPISSKLIRAIENSHIAVVVFSANYAASGWCLEELVKIMDLQKEKSITVMPIFYGVNPCDVRSQSNDVAEQFKKHEGREDPAKVLSWRRALTDFAAISGHYCSSQCTYAQLVDRIADKISEKLTDIRRGNQLVENGKHMKEIKELLDLHPNEKLKMVGIWARGYKSRKALATNAYHNFNHRFDRHCFLGDVEMIPQGRYSAFLHEGFQIERENSSKPKVLLVANNVNDLKQFDALADEFYWFGPGSVVIMTTEDRRLFKSFDINDVYEQEDLRFQTVGAPCRSTRFKKRNSPNNVCCFEEKEEVTIQELDDLFSHSIFGF